jgi:Amt family ammonium transporter
MDRGATIVSLSVCFAAFVVCGWSLLLPTKPQLFGSETIRRRLRFPHWLVMFGAAVVSLGVVFAKTWFAVLEKSQHAPPQESDFLSLATVLVLFMLFGFVAFEAGTVSSAYRNQSAEKNLLVIMVSLASYLGIGRFIYDGFADKPTIASTWIVFQAGFACTVSLIISNALTERASKPTNVLCAIFSAGLGYPVLAGLVWGDTGLLHHIGFVDASGASAVHLLGASASLTAAAAVGPRVRLQRWRFLGGPETPDFSSPWSVVGGLFLMFGWLGFNSGNAATPALHGHAFINTTVGACSGAVAAWLLSRGVGLLIRLGRKFMKTESRQTSLIAIIEGLEARPRIVIGMMGGLVAVTANGALPDVNSLMAAIESCAGGLVAVLVSSWMSARLRSGQIDDPLGVIATHGCAAIVGILSTALWLATVGKPFLPQVAVQLIGCGACIVVGWLVAMVPCLLLLTTERLALGKNTGSWTAAKFRLRLGAIEQLGTPRETPVDLVWNDRIEEATQRILHGVEDDPDKWWDAVEIYATASEVLDKSSQADIAHRIVEKLPDTVDRPEMERVALVALGSSAEYARAEDISKALTQCLERAESDDSHASDEAQDRREMLVWSVALLTERAAVLGKAARPDVLPSAQEGVKFLRKVTKSDKNYRVRDLARIGVIDANARLLSGRGGNIPSNLDGPFDHDGQWQIVYALVTDKTALAMLLFLADRRTAVIADAAQAFKKTPEETLETAMLLASHGLISCNPKKLTINDSGFQLVNRLRHSMHKHERLRA